MHVDVDHRRLGPRRAERDPNMTRVKRAGLSERDPGVSGRVDSAMACSAPLDGEALLWPDARSTWRVMRQDWALADQASGLDAQRTIGSS